MIPTQDPIAILKALIQIPSPNPPGDTQAIAAYIEKSLQASGSSISTPAPAAKPEAVNVVATIGQGEPVIMLHAHIDTVPIASNEADHWSTPPYEAIIKDNRLYGKGSVDDKAPLAAMMATFLEAAQQAQNMQGTLVLVAAAEEEVGGQLGTRWLADHKYLPECDFIIVGEQTHNRASTAHKGVVRATVRATGRAAHATNPARGINAINAMARALLALENYHNDLAQRVHPMVGAPTCNVGVIQGGSTANAVPDTCVAMLDRRMIPGEDPAEVQNELIGIIAALNVEPADIQMGDFLVSNWFSSTIDSSLAKTFLSCIRTELKADPGPVGYLPGSDAKHLTELARGEIVIFGPGSYEVAHAFDEYVDLDEFHSTVAILKDFISQTILRK